MAIAERPQVTLIETNRVSISTNWSTFPAVNDSSREDVVEHHEDGLWTVTNPETGIFGSGPDKESAFEDFEHALLGHLTTLLQSDSLSDGLRAQLGYLLTRLRVS